MSYFPIMPNPFLELFPKRAKRARQATAQSEAQKSAAQQQAQITQGLGFVRRSSPYSRDSSFLLASLKMERTGEAKPRRKKALSVANQMMKKCLAASAN
jgi:hypothetical protein